MGLGRRVDSHTTQTDLPEYCVCTYVQNKSAGSTVPWALCL